MRPYFGLKIIKKLNFLSPLGWTPPLPQVMEQQYPSSPLIGGIVLVVVDVAVIWTKSPHNDWYYPWVVGLCLKFFDKLTMTRTSQSIWPFGFLQKVHILLLHPSM